MRTYRQTAIASNLVQRARILDAVRKFFHNNKYLEVETPLRIPAPAPELHIDAEPSGQWFLHTSPELCMKRLLAAGFPRIFQIARCFRRKERGRRHLPEMTLLEWYTADTDYRAMMDQCQDLVLFLVEHLQIGQPLSYQNQAIDLRPPWPRMAVEEAFARYGSLSMAAALANGRFDEIMGIEIEPRLGLTQPVFLCDYPAACGALARLKPGRPEVAERFELYICGLELCNGFSELTNQVEQRRRFEAESKLRLQSGKEPYPMPEAFLEALADMPPASGNALGLDRLVMLLTDQPHIDGVVAFIPEEL
jgi:lysyl-tRNA synthetase class 2